MEKRTTQQIDEDILKIEKMDNEISDKINHQETMKEQTEKDLQIEIKRKYTEYHNIKRADLPLYKKRVWYSSVWYYKLSCEKTRLLLQRIDIEETEPVNLTTPLLDNFLEKINVDSDEKEWGIAVGKLLTQLDNPK